MDRIAKAKTSIYVTLTIAALVGILSYVFVSVFSFLGLGVILYVYIIILSGAILIYWLTSILNIGWTILAFIINSVIWFGEMVLSELLFHDTLVNGDNLVSVVLALTFGALFFVLNKLLLEELFVAFGATTRQQPRIQKLIERWRH